MNREWADPNDPPTPVPERGGCAIIVVIILAELAIVAAVVLGLWATGMIGR